MNKNQIITLLGQQKQNLKEHHVKALFLFGSVARGEDGPQSDVDILVEFEKDARVGLFELVKLQRTLSNIIGRPVDLSTPESLHKLLKDRILQEAIRAA
jgi:predicted nucleotidyltransferase